jgi:hypothetical protein
MWEGFMSQDQIDYKAVRRRVEEGVQKQKRTTRAVFFAISTIFLFVFGVIAFGILSDAGLAGNEEVVGAMVMMGMAGFMGALFQLISLFLDTKSGEASMRDKLIARELGEEMLRMGLEDDMQQKQKRAMRLASDGELEEIVDNSAGDELIVDEEVPRQRRNE